MKRDPIGTLGSNSMILRIEDELTYMFVIRC